MLLNTLLRAAALPLLLAACDDGATSKPETGARTRDAAIMGAGILSKSGLGTDEKPVDFDVSSLSYIPRPQILDKCQNLLAGVDRRWTTTEESSDDSYIFKSVYSHATHDLRQSMSVLVDAAVPNAFVTITCAKHRPKQNDLNTFTNSIAATYRKSPQTYLSVSRGTFRGRSGAWQTIRTRQKRSKSTIDNYTAYQLRRGRLIKVTLQGFRGAGTKAADATLAPAGSITRITNSNGRTLTLRLTQPAWHNASAVWGVRDAAAHDRFFQKFMGILR
ncbi:hypothetical protein [Puniceibacterium sp. IMCC21224]|uniref:hypothetical protein n=1 Tax=Puniceibacterium sp. IMCC21224 TaxID=1618204 RepID=UPI00064DFFEA|nr:hypothetical protein [Puniceibacterium sp. IMCC21224]KMK66065.1 hypothetical protein IMCC21224_11911 [Puniceibacterium sp. IMCC21224]